MPTSTIVCVCRDNRWTNEATGEDATELVQELVANVDPPLAPPPNLVGMGGTITVTVETD